MMSFASLFKNGMHGMHELIIGRFKESDKNTHSLKVIAEKGRKGWQTNQKKGRLNIWQVLNQEEQQKPLILFLKQWK
jgi:hypothetical protein